MPSPPPRLGPTLLLAVAWVALYLLYLAVSPEPPGTTAKVTVTSTTVTVPGRADS